MKENNEEIKERLLKARALSDEELEQVSGGSLILCAIHGTGTVNGVCPYCSQ